MDKSDNYRNQLRYELNKRRFNHKHYTPQQINNARRLRLQQLEGQIAEHNEELHQIKSSSTSGILPNIIKKILGNRGRNG
jgi:hypothetical protein